MYYSKIKYRYVLYRSNYDHKHCGRVQMLYLEKKINNTFIAGFNELKTMVSEAVAYEDDLAPPPPPPKPSPSAASNSTDDGSSSSASPVVSASDDVHSWSELALQAISKLSDDVEWIKWKANRVTFDILHDYGVQYGFYRLVVESGTDVGVLCICLKPANLLPRDATQSAVMSQYVVHLSVCDV